MARSHEAEEATGGRAKLRERSGEMVVERSCASSGESSRVEGCWGRAYWATKVSILVGCEVDGLVGGGGWMGDGWR